MAAIQIRVYLVYKTKHKFGGYGIQVKRMLDKTPHSVHAVILEYSWGMVPLTHQVIEAKNKKLAREEYIERVGFPEQMKESRVKLTFERLNKESEENKQ